MFKNKTESTSTLNPVPSNVGLIIFDFHIRFGINDSWVVKHELN